MATLALNSGIVKKEKKLRKNFIAPQSLALRLSLFVKENQLTESDFIRQAIVDKLDELGKKKIEEQIKEACENYREFNKQFSSEWAQFETRIE